MDLTKNGIFISFLLTWTHQNRLQFLESLNDLKPFFLASQATNGKPSLRMWKYVIPSSNGPSFLQRDHPRDVTRYPYDCVKGHALYRLKSASYGVHPLQFGSSNTARSAGLAVPGVSLIQFNASGDLFAACGVNGIIRIFDTNECISKLKVTPDDQCIINPLAYIDTMKVNISALQWNAPVQETEQEDVLLVCYRHSAAVQMYMLGEPCVCLKTLLPVKENAEGNLSLICVPGQRVIVGSANGRLRCWSLELRASTKPLWEIHADPQSNPHESNGIVYLQWLEEDIFAAVARHGVITIWNYSSAAMKVKSFGMTASPALLHRISLQVSPAHIKAVSRAPLDHSIFVVLSNQRLFSCGLLTGKILAEYCTSSTAPASATALVEATEEFHGPAQPFTAAPLSPHWEPKIVFHTKYMQSGLRIYSDQLAEASRCLVEASLPSSKYSVTTAFSLALPGTILRATPGDRNVVVSHDFRLYLTSLEIARTSLSRCGEVCFVDRSTGLNYRHTIAFIDHEAIVLGEDYGGPPVCKEDSDHRRWDILTKLMPVSSNQQKRIMTPSPIGPTLLSSIPSVEPVMCMAQHPSLSLLLLGLFSTGLSASRDIVLVAPGILKQHQSSRMSDPLID